MGSSFQGLAHFCPCVIIQVEKYQILGMKVVLVFYSNETFHQLSSNYGRK